MKCPKCQSEMELVTVEGGEVERCTSCKGMWFDALEDTKLKSEAAAIDTGDAATGAAQNSNDKINCPTCANTPLIRMVDKDQPHIWFESCPSCHGRFFDAGEFQDLSQNSISDWIKKFFTKARQ